MKKATGKLSRKARILLLILASAAVLAAGVYGILLLIRSNAAPVNVYSVKDILFSSQTASQSETQGRVFADRMQTVYVSSTQIVREVFVKEGDTVNIGDPLLSFDTTLTDMQLKRQEIKVHQLELEIQQAEKQLKIINTYRVGSPVVHQETAEDLPVYEYYGQLITDRGRGTADDPYVFVWSAGLPFAPADIVALGVRPLPVIPEEGEFPADPGTGGEGGSGDPVFPDQPVPSSTVCAVFESREGNSMLGRVADSYMAVCSIGPDGKYSVIITAVPPTYDPLNPPVKPAPVDNTVYISTWAELNAMKKEAQEKITSLQMEKKKAELDYETLEYELTNGLVVSKVSGVVKTLNDPDEVTGTNEPVLVVSGGGGFFVTGVLSETELSAMRPGDTVNVMSWESYQNYDAEIISVSEFPYEGNEYYHYSQGNSNVSLYPFTAAIHEDAVLREGEFVNISYTPRRSGDSGLYVQKMFIRTENGRSYVFVENSEGLLERRDIVTGGSLWGSYTEVLSGLTEDDHVAFPYGRSVKPGARANEAAIEALYNY